MPLVEKDKAELSRLIWTIRNAATNAGMICDAAGGDVACEGCGMCDDIHEITDAMMALVHRKEE